MIPLKEWCKKRHIGLTTAYSLLKAGQLKAVKLGRLTYITDEADDDFIKNLKPYSKEIAA